MSNLPQDVTTRPLSQVAIPGKVGQVCASFENTQRSECLRCHVPHLENDITHFRFAFRHARFRFILDKR